MGSNTGSQICLLLGRSCCWPCHCRPVALLLLAYTGRSLHHNTTYQASRCWTLSRHRCRQALNPIHGLYFTSMMVDQPFTHLMINHGILHWLAMGSPTGWRSSAFSCCSNSSPRSTTIPDRSSPLIGLTALPVILDIFRAISNSFVNIGYSALGVAVFAVGVLFIYTDRFGTIQLAGQYDDP